jgi:hypothetical protein
LGLKLFRRTSPLCQSHKAPSAEILQDQGENPKREGKEIFRPVGDKPSLRKTGKNNLMLAQNPTKPRLMHFWAEPDAPCKLQGHFLGALFCG